MLCGLAASSALAAGSWTSNHINDLNQTLHGRVFAVEPFAKPCFSMYNGQEVTPDPEKCRAIQAQYSSPTFRAQFPGAYMYEESSICASDNSSTDQCLLNSDDPKDAKAFAASHCNQGNVPTYYIEVKTPNDAVQAFKYAGLSGGKLAIKNSGHSFQKDSSEKGALMLWTRNLRTMTRNTSFVPEGCSANEAYNAITTGAGVNCGEAYEFAGKNNATLVCAYSPTVGLSGGFVQSGGHGVLTPTLGLASDRVLQFTVVTPDGQIRVANKCQNRDLFWALRGGGGGTFGVVIDSTHRVENTLPIAVASIGVDGTDKKAVIAFMETLVDATIDLAKDGWGGHIYGNKIVYVTPTLTDAETAKKSMAKMIEVAKQHGGTANVSITPNFFDFYKEYIISGAAKVGIMTLINTRLMPASVFTTPELNKKLKEHLRRVINGGVLPYVPVSGPYLYKDTTKGTSVHPVWKTALWEYGDSTTWAWNSTLETRTAVVEEMRKHHDEFVKLMPGSGAYRNEGFPFNHNWIEDNFGPPYERLLEIKKRYDPKSLLKCHKCVGWTDQDAQESCFRAFETAKG
ncbi:hypothetical protein QQS21_000841 [Conoideocrella luteorostrata]|uniref:FAD-binding PCMH-type domain-containing protein n=1 Tax=Conoideocrella luteorostrata TaxID=1105319 RepID=A0AAJ0CY46_9HYPO|nr:hypothetical protein QQS21_000841 [Conoideocrella luteorostrata]